MQKHTKKNFWTNQCNASADCWSAVHSYTTYNSKFGSLLCDLNECLSSANGDYFFDLQRFNIR